MLPPHHADRTRTPLCRCGHERDLHEHHRPGSDCGVGGPAHCAAFRHSTPLLTRLLDRVRHPAVQQVGDLATVHPLAAHRNRVAATGQVATSGRAEVSAL